MSKLIRLPFLAALVASVAIAGGYSAFTQSQTGNGTNGMTYTVTAGDGAGVILDQNGRAVTNYAKVSIRAQSTHVFQNATDFSWLRCQHYGQDPRKSAGSSGNAAGATLLWKPCPQFDIEVDGGQSGKQIGLNAMEFYVGPLPPSAAGEAYTWTGENLQQSTTLDAGVDVAVELFTLN